MLLLLMTLHFAASQSTESTTTTVATTTLPNASTRSTTTIPPPTSTAAPVEIPNATTNVDFCTCDLYSKICDVNCCCDKDCSTEDKKVFSSCKLEPNLNRDTSYCQYVDYIYMNNTQYEWEVNQNGLFCIAKTNLPAKYLVETKPITTLEDSQLQKQNKFSWPDTDPGLSLEFSSNESFIYSSNIWIIKNKTLQVFELSEAFITHLCLTKRAVKYLQDFKSVCSRQDVTEHNLQLQPETYYRNMTIVRAPKFLNTSEILSCPKNICIPIEVKDCRGCVSMMGCRLNRTTNENFCWNLAQKIEYNFYHNGSQGFTRVELLLQLTNVSFPSNTFDFEFQQEFEVNFHWHNSSLNYSQMLSGNPGYLTGKPVLIGNLANVSEFKIERNPLVVSENFLTLPASKQGLCEFNNATYVLAEFGYNMLLKCRIRRQLEVGNLTAGDLCRTAQNEIFHYWPISSNRSNVNRVVGIFGNSNKSSDWLQVVSNVSPSSILNETTGNFSANVTLLCKLATTLKIDIFYGRVAFKKLLNQNKIVGATFNFTQMKNCAFNIDAGRLTYEILIMEEVMFYDVTSEQVEKFVDPPSFQIRLPHDFFYPFIKVGNGVDAPHCNAFVKLFYLLSIVSLTLSWVAY